MACGLPPVATRTGGVPELITHGVDGFLEPVGDIAAQAARVIALLTDDALYARISAAARHTAETRYCTESMIPQYEHYYEEVCAAMNLLAVGAHPDDIEFGCAPVLIKEIRKGNQVKLLVLSRGEAGTGGTPEIREQESREPPRASARASNFWISAAIANLEYTPDNRLPDRAEIRTFRPSIVLAPHIGENQHPDHAVVGKLTRDACRLARYGGILEASGRRTKSTTCFTTTSPSTG